MKLNHNIAFVGGLIVALVLAQAPVMAGQTQQSSPARQNQNQTPTVQMVILRLDKNSHKTPAQATAELQLLTPDEIQLLAANPRMMNVGGMTSSDANDTLVTIALVGLVVLIVVVVVVVATR